MYFWYFIFISPWKRAGPFRLTKLNPLYPRMHCAKFGWNWPSGSGERFSILSMNLCFFVIISPWKYLKKIESPAPKDAFCNVWLKLAKGFWRRRFFNFVNVFLLFHNYFPRKRAEPFIWTTWIPCTQGCFVPSLLEIGPVVLEKKMKNRKVLQQWRRRTTDIYLSEKLTQAFGSGELIKMVKTSIVVRTFKPSLSLTIKYVQINDNTSNEMWPIGMIHWWLNGCTHIKRISRGTTKMPVPMKKNTVCGPLSQEYT